MRVWAALNNGGTPVPETAVCDNHKTDEMAGLFDCSENEELECNVCGSRSTAYVLRTARLVVQDATDEIRDLNSLVLEGHAGIQAIAVMNCNLANMIYALAKCVEQLANDQL